MTGEPDEAEEGEIEEGDMSGENPSQVTLSIRHKLPFLMTFCWQATQASFKRQTTTRFKPLQHSQVLFV